MISSKFNLFIFYSILSSVQSAFISKISPNFTTTRLQSSQSLPVVIWHGLGDAYKNAGLVELAKKIDQRYPDTSVYMIKLADSSEEDRRATWFGSANEEVQSVCDQLLGIDELLGGFDGIGFSQGGQFMRAYVERCNKPKVRNLITLGAQHMGISGYPPCKSILDLGCHVVHKLIQAGTVYGSYAQKNIIPAQYFRDQCNLAPYLKYNKFLRDINNERFNDTQIEGGSFTERSQFSDDDEDKIYQPRNETYKLNFESLNNFIMFEFSLEHVVIPSTSAFFTLPNVTRPDISNPFDPIPIALQDLPIYKEDYIGLKVLDEAGKIHYGTCLGEHMIINEQCWENVMSWLGDGDQPTNSESPGEAYDFQLINQQILQT